MKIYYDCFWKIKLFWTNNIVISSQNIVSKNMNKSTITVQCYIYLLLDPTSNDHFQVDRTVRGSDETPIIFFFIWFFWHEIHFLAWELKNIKFLVFDLPLGLLSQGHGIKNAKTNNVNLTTPPTLILRHATERESSGPPGLSWDRSPPPGGMRLRPVGGDDDTCLLRFGHVLKWRSPKWIVCPFGLSSYTYSCFHIRRISLYPQYID